VTHLAQRFGFNLADALACEFVALAQFLQSVRVTVYQPEPHFHNLAFAFIECAQNTIQILLQEAGARLDRRVLRRRILDEITEAGVIAVAERTAGCRELISGS